MAQSRELVEELALMLAAVAGDCAHAEASFIVEAARTQRPNGYSGLALHWAQRRSQGVPLGQVVGRQQFLGVDLLVGEKVLSPRPETEILGREVLEILRERIAADPSRELRIIDMGCGSGNLACALAVAVPSLRVWASDISVDCAEATRVNVARLSLQGRVQVFQGDLFAPLGGMDLEGTMDLVLMNPPYIPSASLEKGRAELLRHEPREAFDGGPYGMSILGRLLDASPAFLNDSGVLLFEFGLGQERIVQVTAERKRIYKRSRMVLDVRGRPRVMVLER